MSLMSKIGRGLLAKPKAAEPKPLPTPKAPPKAKSAETRQRMSESAKRRYAKSDPVPTSALPRPSPPDLPEHVPGTLDAVFLDEPVNDVRELDVEDSFPEVREEPVGIEVRGQPLPPPRPTPAPPDAAVIAAARAAPEKEAAAAALEEKKAAIEATAKWKSQCKAIDPANGMRCCLMSGHTVLHKSNRGEFRTIAQGRLTVRLDESAWSTRTTSN